MSSTASSYY